MPNKKRKKKKKPIKKNSTGAQPTKGNDDEDEEDIENIVDPNQLKFIYSKCVRKVIQTIEEKDSENVELPLVCSYSGFRIELSPFPEIFAEINHGKTGKFNEVLPEKSKSSLPPLTISDKQPGEKKTNLRTDTSCSNSTNINPSRRSKKSTVNFLEDKITSKRTVTLPPIFALTRTQTTGTMNLS